MPNYAVRMDTEIMPITIDQAETREAAQAIANDWNKRYGTTDPRFDDHAKVYPLP